MYASSLLVFVVVVGALGAHVENGTETEEAGESLSGNFTTEMTSEQTSTTSSVPVSRNNTADLTSTSTADLIDDKTTVITESSGKSTSTIQPMVAKGGNVSSSSQIEMTTSTATSCSNGGCTVPSTESSKPGSIGKTFTGDRNDMNNVSDSQHSSPTSELSIQSRDNNTGSDITSKNLTTNESAESETTTDADLSVTTQHRVVTTDSTTIVSGIDTTIGMSESKDLSQRADSLSVSATHLSVLGVVGGIIGALIILLCLTVVYGRLKDPRKKKMCLNKEANRIDMRILRRFTINDVKASFGGIPTNGDIWHEMNRDSSVVV